LIECESFAKLLGEALDRQGIVHPHFLYAFEGVAKILAQPCIGTVEARLWAQSFVRLAGLKEPQMEPELRRVQASARTQGPAEPAAYTGCGNVPFGKAL
jgi:hypothetical protein